MTTKQEKDVVGIAKGTPKKGRTRKPPATAKKRTPTTKKKVDKSASEKAKETVTELLSDVNLTPNAEKESFELIEETPEKVKSTEWLAEQVEKLTKENGELKQQLGNAKNSSVEANVIGLFNEFQGEYLKHSPQTMAHTQIYLTALMGKMLVAFPFLQPYKKF